MGVCMVEYGRGASKLRHLHLLRARGLPRGAQQNAAGIYSSSHVLDHTHDSPSRGRLHTPTRFRALPIERGPHGRLPWGGQKRYGQSYRSFSSDATSSTRSVSSQSFRSQRSPTRSSASPNTELPHVRVSQSDRTVVLTHGDVTSQNGKLFRDYQRVFENRMHHFVTPEARQATESEGWLRPKDSAEVEDGLLGASTAPPSFMFRLNPQWDFANVPFSLYPQSAEPGSEIACASVDILQQAIHSEQVSTYFGSAVAVNSISDGKTRVHAYVVFARHRRDVEWCEAQGLVRLPNNENPLLSLDSNGHLRMPTGISGSVVRGSRSRRTLRLVLGAVILGDLPLGDLQWSKAYRLKHVRGKGSSAKLDCPLDGCQHVSTAMWKLKDHYRDVHTDTTYDCELCPEQFTRRGFLRTHLQRIHRASKNNLHLHQDFPVATAKAFA